MKQKILAILVVIAIAIPALGLGEATLLPFGLQMGMNANQTREAFAADATLSALTPDKSDYGNGAVEYLFEDVLIPGTDLTVDNLYVQVDQNNSAKADRLSSISCEITPEDNSIALFRKLFTALTAKFGAPESDPFSPDAANNYVEWGTLDASWTLPDVRVSLTLNRMYEESITVQYSSRLNYDKADLAD